MSAPFQPGDVVVCVDASPFPCPGGNGRHLGGNVKLGAIYRLTTGEVVNRRCGCCRVVYFGSGELYFGNVSRFRKIEAPKSEIADLIRACKPVKVSA